MSHKKRVKNEIKVQAPVVVTGRISGRVPCAGGCGKLVIQPLGECRTCRRARTRAGMRVLAKLAKGSSDAKEEE